MVTGAAAATLFVQGVLVGGAVWVGVWAVTTAVLDRRVRRERAAARARWDAMPRAERVALVDQVLDDELLAAEWDRELATSGDCPCGCALLDGGAEA